MAFEKVEGSRKAGPKMRLFEKRSACPAIMG